MSVSPVSSTKADIQCGYVDVWSGRSRSSRIRILGMSCLVRASRILTRQLEQVAIAGAGLLSFSVALNAITENATCTVAFVVIGAVLNFGFSSIQTLDKISWVGWVGLASILSSIITLAVSVGVGGRPALAPQQGDIEIITHVVRETSFVDAINAVSVIVLAYAGTPNFLNIVGEMRNQKGTETRG
jgi:amino acid permease